MRIMSASNQIETIVGVPVRVSQRSLRADLWQLCEQAFPNYFEDHPLNDDAFRDEEEWSNAENEKEAN